MQPQGAGKWNKAGTARAAGRQAGGQVERSEEGGGAESGRTSREREHVSRWTEVSQESRGNLHSALSSQGQAKTQ